MRRGIFVSLCLCFLIALAPVEVGAKCVDALVSSPNPGAYPAVFKGIGGSGPSDIWAVGSGQPPESLPQSLIEHWNGTVWSIVPAPTVPGSVIDPLFGVTADSPTDAWAFGEWGPKRTFCCSRPLLEHWDGTSWTAVKGGFDTTDGLASISSAPGDPVSVWVVGYSGYLWNCQLPQGCPLSPLAELWTGTTWFKTRVPFSGASATLSGVLSLPGGSVWAVGTDFEGHNGQNVVPLLLHRVQGKWIAIQGAILHGGLANISGSSDSDVWVVGDHVGPQTVEHWNGAEWTEVALPRPESTFVSSISVASPTDAWISGAYQTKAGVISPYLAHWGGTVWSWSVASPIGSENGSDDSVFDTTGGAWTAGSALLYPPSTVPETFTTYAHC
jgi:hypothetical protein